MAAAQRGAVLAAYRRALKLARDWPRMVGDFDTPPNETTVVAQVYIRNEARSLIQRHADEQNSHIINKCVLQLPLLLVLLNM